MVLQVLVLLPLLTLSGFACGALANRVRQNKPVDAELKSDNTNGVAAACAAIAAIGFWLIPSVIDSALDSVRIEMTRYASFWLIGLLACGGTYRAVTGLQLFLITSVAVVVFTVGIIFMTTPDRLCWSYRLEDQTATGTGLVILSVIAIAWVLTRAIKEYHSQRSSPTIPSR